MSARSWSWIAFALAAATAVYVLHNRVGYGWVPSTVTIQRPNSAFRAIEVPAGRSRVEFRYAPRSVMLGALVSAASLLVVLAVRLARRGAQ